MEIDEQEMMRKLDEAAKTATDVLEKFRLKCLAKRGVGGFKIALR